MVFKGISRPSIAMQAPAGRILSRERDNTTPIDFAYGSGTLKFEMSETCHLVGRYSQSPTWWVWAQTPVGVFDRRPTTSLRIENFTGPNR
jgi:hypothetical protein